MNDGSPNPIQTGTSAASDSPLAKDCAGMDFYAVDRGLQDLFAHYVDPALRPALQPHLARMGQLAGGRLDELARIADRHGPVLHARDRLGRDEDWIEYHPAYREMEAIAFGDFQFHAMSHRAGTLGLDRPVPFIAKYALQYLFVQAEFGLMCPISVSDTSVHLIRRYGSPELKAYLLPRMLSADMATLWKGTQFMTEKRGGSDVGQIETIARQGPDGWRLTGEKWFCSHTDADVALMLARPEGAPDGTRGLALFACPRRLEDGSRNSYRIVRLKDKMGTKSMASGEIRFENARAWLVGDVTRGLKQMMDQVNLSRLSHGIRAAAMMRRCLNEALAAARSRRAFGNDIVTYPLLRRQLMKILVPTEQALSMSMTTAAAMDRETAGDNRAKQLLRILTPLMKLRACRDNIRVATGAMEVRGGNGYIEEWVNPRLVRDAHIGVLWEGTSNVNALDAISRAVAKEHADHEFKSYLLERMDETEHLPAAFAARLRAGVDRAFALAERVARSPGNEQLARVAATALYNVASAVMLAWEGTRPGFDARRALVARMVLEHRIEATDPLAPRDDAWEKEAIALLIDPTPVPRDRAMSLLAA
ncbi:MAG: acyl-CoA dehydrogenase family protein [Hyphomicrobiaceae bacterium]